ncbi:MAG TPA: hypothetical protein VEH28_00425 [Thermoplasmata archaeon]|nr:hypothetical protein [Thermoplasmata archaeon]
MAVNWMEVVGGTVFTALAILGPVLAVVQGYCGLLLYWVGPTCLGWVAAFAVFSLAGTLYLLLHGLLLGYSDD